MKGLDSLKEIKDFLIDIVNGSSISAAMRMTDSYVYLEKHINNIEKSLKEGEEAKQMIRNFNKMMGEPAIIEPNIDKKLKALEIIKNKRININYIVYSKLPFLQTYEGYVEHWNEMQFETRPDFVYLGELLTQEEWELLREVLL